MNRIYRVIFNHTLGVWQAVSEIGKGRKKSKTNKSVPQPGLLAILSRISGKAALGSLLLVSSQVMADALPTGGQVVAGSAAISQNGAVMDITQTTDKTAINWQTFNIGQGNTVNFHQPSASSVALNRVIGSDVSQIQGAINANGQVFLINPNGIMFSQTAQVNVGGLVASTLNISTEDFLAGNYTFEGVGSNAIINQGNITAANGGYIAMIAAKIENTGAITATGGDVLMGAGSKVTLDMGGPIKIQVEQKAIDALITNGGAIKADGGYIYLTAQAAGDLASTVINNSGIIQAQTLASGESGEIYLMGDMDNDRIQVGGTLDASAPTTGNGGFIETSAAKVKIADDLKVTTQAENGQTGEWLIDPYDFTVAATGGDITGAALSTMLGANSILIKTVSGTNSATDLYSTTVGNGDIFVNDAVTWSSGNDLILYAGRNIEINATMDASSGAGGQLVLYYGQGAVAAGNTATYTINAPVKLQTGNKFGTQLGQDGGLVVFQVINTPSDFATLLNNSSGNFALGSDKDLSYLGQTDWTPITGFTGNFEGLGHTITNLRIVNSTANNVGLFSVIGENSTISNLSMIAANVHTTGMQAGLLAGSSTGHIYNVDVQGWVTAGTGHGGGLVGRLNSGTSVKAASIRHSSAQVDVGGATALGGLVGSVGYGYVEDAYATGDVTGSGDDIGGLIGQLGANGSTVDYATNVYATGTVVGRHNVGGVVGNIFYSSLTNAYGSNQGVNNYEAVDSIVDSTYIGGVYGLSFDSTVTNAYYDLENNPYTMSDASLGKMHAEIRALVTDGTWDSAKWSITGGGASVAGYEIAMLPFLTKVTKADDKWLDTLFSGGWGDVNNDGAYGIGSWAQLQNINYVADQGYDFVLQDNLVDYWSDYQLYASATANSGMGWNPIGTATNPFKGSFDGASYSISGLNITSADTADYVGLFGYTAEFSPITPTEIKNLTLNVNIDSAANSTGGLVGYAAQGTEISNVTVSGTLTGTARSGGLVGYMTGSRSQVSGSGSSVDVTGGQYTGGLIGYLNTSTKISTSYASGSVTGTTSVGGLIGFAVGQQVAQSFATGYVSGETQVGGLIGYSGVVSLEDVYATGNVQVAQAGTGILKAGGLIGFANSGSITNAYASNTVTASLNDGQTAVLAGLYTLGSFPIETTNGVYDKETNTSTAMTDTSLGRTQSQIRQFANLANWSIVDGGDTVEGYGARVLPYLVDSVLGDVTPDALKSASTTLFAGGWGQDAYDPNTYVPLHYQIKNWEQLQNINLIADQLYSYRLMNNLDSTTAGYAEQASATANGGAGWTPIGSLVKPFVGNFSGGSNIIYDLNINSTADYVGLFGVTESLGAGDGYQGDARQKITNFEILDAKISSTGDYVGGLVGLAQGTFFNDVWLGGDWYNTHDDVNPDTEYYRNLSIVTGRDYVGGLIGFLGDSTAARGSVARATSDGSSAGAEAVVSGRDYVGGFIGQVAAADVYDSNALGSVTATGIYVGGFVGSGYDMAGNLLYSSSNVTGTNYVGGLFGHLGAFETTTTLSNVGAGGSVTATGNYVGGLVGRAQYATVSAGYAIGDVAGNNYVGGLIGDMGAATLSESFSSGEAAGAYVGGLVGSMIYSTVADTYTTSTVRATADGSSAYLGGLVASMDNSSLTTSYAAGGVNFDGHTPLYKGVLVGSMKNNGSFTYNRYNTDLYSGVGSTYGYNDGSVTVTGVNALTTTSMKRTDLFTTAGWSIDNLGADGNVWRIYEGYTAPLLRAFMWDDQIAQERTSQYDGQVVNPYNSWVWDTVDRTGVDATSGLPYIVYTDSAPVRDFAGALVGQKDAGTYGYDVFSTQFGTNYQVLDATNQLVSSNGLTWEITKRQLTVSGLTAQSKTYDGTTDATFSGTGDLNTGNIVVTGSWTDAYWNLTSEEQAAWDATNREDVSVSGTAGLAFADKNAGDNKDMVVSGLTLTGVDAHNYELVASGVTANIYKANLNVTGLTAQDKVYDRNTTATLGGTAAVAALVGDSVSLSGTATGSFSNKNVGENKTVYTSGLTLIGDDAGNYNLIQQAGLTASISKADLAVTGATASNKVYDATTAATVTGGAVTAIAGDSVTLSAANATFADKNVGLAKAVTTAYTISGTDAGNYNLIQQTGLSANITKADLTLTGLTAENKVYDTRTNASLAGTAGVVVLDEDDVTVNGFVIASFADKNAGDGKAVTLFAEMELVGTDAGNYRLVLPTDLTANITKADLDVTGLSAENKVYDATTAAVLSGTAAITALSGDSVTLDGSVSGAFADKNAGDNKAIVLSGLSLSGADAGNYILVSPTDLTANITKADLAVTGATASNKVYDATTAATVSDGAVMAIDGDTVVLSGTSGTFVDKNAGTGKAVTTAYTLSGTDAGNYNVIQQTGLSADISKADIQVTGLAGVDRTYDTTTIAGLTGTASVTGLLEDEVSVGGTASGAFADKNVGVDKAVTVTGLTLSGADAGNYNLVHPTDVTATISKANLDVTGLSATNRVYDTTTDAVITGTAAVSALSGDVVTLDGTVSGAFANKNVGEGKAIVLSGLSLSGADAGNYTLVAPSDLTADIIKFDLQLSGLTAQATRTYDGTTAIGLSGTAAISSGLGGDSVSLTGSASGSFANKNVGVNKAITIAGLSLTGAESANYNLVLQNNLTATINKADLTVTGASAANKVYDATTAITVTGGSVSAIDGDEVTLSAANATVADKNVGNGKTVTTAYTISGTDAGNYNLIQQAGLAADIAAKQLTISGLVAANKMFDGSSAASITNWGVLQGLEGGETLTLNHGSASFDTPYVGQGKTVTAIGYSLADGSGLASNYQLAETLATTTAAITPATEVNNAVSDAQNSVTSPIQPPVAPTSLPSSLGDSGGTQTIGGLQLVEVTVEPGQGGEGGDTLPQATQGSGQDNTSGMQTVFVVNGGIRVPDVSLITEE